MIGIAHIMLSRFNPSTLFNRGTTTRVDERAPSSSRTPAKPLQASTLVGRGEVGPDTKSSAGKIGPMQARLLKEWDGVKDGVKKRATTAKAGLRQKVSATIHNGYEVAEDKVLRNTVGASRVVNSQWELDALATVGKTKGIAEITLDGNDFDNKDLELLKEKFPDLRHVHLKKGGGQITDAGLVHLKDMPLESLELAGCHIITNAGLEACLAGKQLTRLKLNGCSQISGAILKHLDTKKIKELELAGTNIGTVTPEIVQSIVNMPSLERLDIRSAYTNCSMSAFNVLRALLDDKLLSDGIRGEVGGDKQEQYAQALMKQLFNENRIRHGPSLALAKSEILGIEPESSLSAKAVMKVAGPIAQEVANKIVSNAMESETWQRKGEILPAVVEGIGEQLLKGLRENNPLISAIASAVSSPSTIAPDISNEPEVPPPYTVTSDDSVAPPAYLAETEEKTDMGKDERPSGPEKEQDDPTRHMPGAWVD